MCAAQQLMDDPEVGGLIRSVLEHVQYEVEQEIRAELKTELLTVQRKRELLANIATGEMYAVQNYKGKDCNQCTQMVRPTINQVLKAIDLDSKLAGHYSVRQATVDSLQLTKSENTSETQQNATAHLSLAGGGVHRTGVECSRSTENTSETQQNATTDLSPAGGGVRRTGVEYSRSTESTSETQQNATIIQKVDPQKVENAPGLQHFATKSEFASQKVERGRGEVL